MAEKTKGKPFTDDEKALVAGLKEKLGAAGVSKFPQDWHLKQLSTARRMLAGDNAPTLQEWLACIDWAFSDAYWQDKVDHLARVMALWPKYKLQMGGDGTEKYRGGHRTAIDRGSYSERANFRQREMPF